MLMKLYEPTDILREIELEIEENGGELTPQLEFRLDRVLRNRTEKAASITRQILNNEATANALGLEIKRLQGHKKRLETNSKHWRGYLSRQIQQDEKLDTGFAVLSWRRNPPSIEVDEKTLAKKWCEKTYTPLKRKIKLALQAGEKIRGAKLITDKMSFSIK